MNKFLVVVIIAILALVSTTITIMTITTTAVSKTSSAKTFEECWKKTLSELGVKPSTVLSIKQSIERQVMAGNLTTNGLKESSSNPNNPFVAGIYDCMNS